MCIRDSLLGSVALARAARGEDDVAAISVLKLLGSEAERRAFEFALESAGPDGLIHPGQTGPYAHMNLDHYFASWFDRYARSFSGTIAGGTSETVSYTHLNDVIRNRACHCAIVVHLGASRASESLVQAPRADAKARDTPGVRGL